MIALAGAGFRVIAPDYRGYGLSDPPPQPEKASFSLFISDIRAMLDALNIHKVLLITIFYPRYKTRYKTYLTFFEEVNVAK